MLATGALLFTALCSITRIVDKFDYNLAVIIFIIGFFAVFLFATGIGAVYQHVNSELLIPDYADCNRLASHYEVIASECREFMINNPESTGHDVLEELRYETTDQLLSRQLIP